jgi:hypothetical protein
VPSLSPEVSGSTRRPADIADFSLSGIMKIITKVCLYGAWLCSDIINDLCVYFIVTYDRIDLIAKGNNAYIKLSIVTLGNSNVDIVVSLTLSLCTISHYLSP